MPSSKKPGGGQKKPKPAATEDEGSHIIFTNSKDDGKKKSKANQSGASSSKAGNAQNAGENAPKQPSARELVGGSSWTGKLPVNLLYEHCVKQGWGKPEYSMRKLGEGRFVSAVTLKSVHPKTKELRTLEAFEYPGAYSKKTDKGNAAAKPTAVEARNFAAVYALFRVCSMKNIHMMLPPDYRDLWKGEFSASKTADVANGKAWMYEADPFTAAEERDAAKAAAEKAAADRREAAARGGDANMLKLPGGKNLGSGSSTRSHSRDRDRNVHKGWTNIPRVEMGKKIRAQVEDLVRRDTLWNPYGITMGKHQRESVIKDLVQLGFRKEHIEEASEECKDREEVLEWLLVHVPDDDLPPWSLPDNYGAGVALAGDIKREASLKRLVESGYPSTACEQMLLKHNGNESKALEELQRQLMSGQDLAAEAASLSLADGQNDTIWEDEMETLGAIYDAEFKQISPTHCSIRLEVPRATKPYLLHFWKSPSYPNAPPLISLSCDLPAYIRLSVYREALRHAVQSFLGDPMLFNIVDWVQSNVGNVVDNPGKLRDVTAVIVADSPDQSEGVRRSNANARRKHKPEKIVSKPGSAESKTMLAKWTEKHATPAQKKMMNARQSLPAWQQRQVLVQTVLKNQVTIISGETGSGKSTQSVQFILDDMIEKELGAATNIICTQPRRISALGLADRVSEERCSPVGQEVGYTIRGESKRTSSTKITFVTTGVLLRRLQTSGGTTQDVVDSLSDVSHVVVDEVHERSLDTDFLLILLRDVLRKRKDLKVILMSATLDAAVFENYFKATASVGKVEIAGRTFPVEDLYLDDVINLTGFQPRAPPRHQRRYEEAHENESANEGEKSMATIIQNIGMRINYDLVVATVQAIDAELGSTEGGILIFLPGTAEINQTVNAFQNLSQYHALPLHASLTPAEQRRVFPPAPKGKRKVIAATNVAETSITIEDILAVIDTGKVKETSYDVVNGMVKLEETWASRAACKQRRGRAGRVRAGKCYKLFTKNMEGKMADRPDPEIRRVPLEQLCLSVRAMGIRDIANFLANTLTPPEVTAVEGAIQLLGRMGAIDDGELTALGRHLSLIPADLRCGKLIVYGALFGCLEACLTVAAILTVRSPFISPQSSREEAKAARLKFATNQGDLIGDLRAYEEWARSRSQLPSREIRLWCDDNFLSSQTLFDISSNRAQFIQSLKEVGFLPSSYRSADSSPVNANNDDSNLLRALVAGSFHPQTARIAMPETKYIAAASGAVAQDPEARTIKYFAEGDVGRVFVHPSSTLFDAQGFAGNATFMSYFTKMATSKVFIRDLTPFNAYSLLLFGGSIALDTLGRGLVVDGWLRLRGWARIGVLVSRLRGMLDQLLARHLETPGAADEMARSEVVGVVRRLIEFDGLDR